MSTPISISGSRSSAILGVSPYQTNLQIWLEIMESRQPGFCEKNGYKLELFEGNDLAKWGTCFEDSICSVVERVQNSTIYDRERFFEVENVTCHIDGLIDIDCECLLVENKTTSAHYFYDNFSEKLNRIPLGYMCQIQHNLYLSGLNKCMMNVLVFPKRVDDFVAEGVHIATFGGIKLLVKDGEPTNIEDWVVTLAQMGYLKTFIIERDDELIEMMLEKYSTFWNENILGGKMPDITTLDDFKKVYTSPKGTVIATEQIERWDAERKQLMSEKKEIDKRIEQIKVLLMEYLKSNDGEIDDETREKTFLMSRDGRKLLQYDGRSIR